MLFTENNRILSEKLNIFSGCIFGQMWQKYRGRLTLIDVGAMYDRVVSSFDTQIHRKITYAIMFI
jgi:hypothetical protein